MKTILSVLLSVSFLNVHLAQASGATSELAEQILEMRTLEADLTVVEAALAQAEGARDRHARRVAVGAVLSVAGFYSSRKLFRYAEHAARVNNRLSYAMMPSVEDGVAVFVSGLTVLAGLYTAGHAKITYDDFQEVASLRRMATALTNSVRLKKAELEATLLLQQVTE